MIELSLVYEGNGRFRCSSKADYVTATDNLDQGQPVRVKITKQRSIDQHRWVFSMFQAAFDNQRAGPRLPSMEHLRKHILIQAGHCDVETFEPGAMTREMARWLRGKFGIEFSTDGELIYAKTARSIAFKNCDADEMHRVADAVVDVICERIVPGTTRKDWEPYLDRQGKQQKRADRSAENAGASMEGHRGAGRQHSE